jgi:hypothetical protein
VTELNGGSRRDDYFTVLSRSYVLLLARYSNKHRLGWAML